MKAADSDHAIAIAVMVLGAGRSQRFKGGGKLDQCLMGKPVAHHVLSTLRAFNWGQKVVVSCSGAAWVQAYVDAGFVDAQIDNADTGIAGSIHCGLSKITTQHWVMICLADMPLITRCHIQQLLTAFDRNRAVPVATQTGSGFGPPIIIPKALLDALPETGDPDVDALLRNADGPCAADWMLRDIDTIADLQKAAQHLRAAEH